MLDIALVKNGFKRWWHTIKFVLLTTVALLLIYREPDWLPILGVILAVITLVLYLVFVKRHRPNQLQVTVASLAFAIGPTLSTGYVWARSPALYKLAHEGGDVLIQLSSFFTGLLVLLVAIVSILLKDEKTRLERIDGLAVVLIFLAF